MKINKHVRALSSDGATVAKVMATFCVVLAHSHKLFGYMEVEDAVYFLRGVKALGYCSVPVFFLLSGYFLIFTGGLNWQKNLGKKTKSLLIPYCIFILVYALISCFGSLVLPGFFDDFREFTAYDWLIRLFGIPFSSSPRFYGPLWFVRELFILNILSFAIVPVVKKTSGYVLFPVAMVVYFLPIPQIIRHSVVFFVVGIYFGFKKRIPIINNWVCGSVRLSLD